MQHQGIAGAQYPASRRVGNGHFVRYEGVFLNRAVPPLGEIGVRQALNYATNKAAINEAVYGGVGEIANSMIPKAKSPEGCPSPLDIPSGCRFRTRCPYATDVCETDDPALAPDDRPHQVACHVLPFGPPTEG